MKGLGLRVCCIWGQQRASWKTKGNAYCPVTANQTLDLCNMSRLSAESEMLAFPGTWYVNIDAYRRDMPAAVLAKNSRVKQLRLKSEKSQEMTFQDVLKALKPSKWDSLEDVCEVRLWALHPSW